VYEIMDAATRLRSALSKENASNKELDAVTRDLETMKVKLARLKSRGGLFATVNFGDAVVELMNRIDATSAPVTLS
jgi:hypothetical protein